MTSSHLQIPTAKWLNHWLDLYSCLQHRLDLRHFRPVAGDPRTEYSPSGNVCHSNVTCIVQTSSPMIPAPVVVNPKFDYRMCLKQNPLKQEAIDGRKPVFKTTCEHQKSLIHIPYSHSFHQTPRIFLLLIHQMPLSLFQCTRIVNIGLVFRKIGVATPGLDVLKDISRNQACSMEHWMKTCKAYIFLLVQLSCLEFTFSFLLRKCLQNWPSSAT